MVLSNDRVHRRQANTTHRHNHARTNRRSTNGKQRFCNNSDKSSWQRGILLQLLVLLSKTSWRYHDTDRSNLFGHILQTEPVVEIEQRIRTPTKQSTSTILCFAHTTMLLQPHVNTLCRYVDESWTNVDCTFCDYYLGDKCSNTKRMGFVKIFKFYYTTINYCVVNVFAKLVGWNYASVHCLDITVEIDWFHLYASLCPVRSLL